MTRFGKLSFAEAIGLIETRLKEAMATLRKCQFARHDIPDKMRAGWPAIVRQVEDAYGYYGDPGHPLIGPPDPPEKRPEPKPAAPAPEWIDRMDKALNWLWWVEEGSRKFVAGKAAGLTWGVMAEEAKMPMIEIRTRHKLALEAIFEKLVEEG